MEIENQNTFGASLVQGVNLFLGAGFSVLAKDANKVPLPLGKDLKSEITGEFPVAGADSLDLSQICTVIGHSKRADLRSFLQKRFTVHTYDSRYDTLDKSCIKVQAIFTTNIDDLLYQIYAKSQTSYLNDLDIRGPAYNDRRAIDMVTLHGCVLDKTRPFRFGTAELATAFASDPDRWHFLTNRLQRFPTLFWGYSISDAGALQALSGEAVAGREHKDKWIVVHPSSADAGTLGYFRALGFQIITADTGDMLDYLSAVQIPSEVIPSAKIRLSDLFPQDSIPAIGSVPVRPIVEFFLGSLPQWSDIFSGHLHKTAHFHRIRDSVNSGKNTIVIGVPACGKTTLLMQSAADINCEGDKLYCQSLTPEKSRLIENELAGAKALIFIDNFADSVEAFEYLAACPNIQVVGADRDYNFEIISHRIDRRYCNIVDVTELTDADIQACLRSIPEGVTRLYRKDTGPGIQPSLFEIIEANLTHPTLSERFRTVLSELAKEDPSLRDLLLMISYVHRCRVPVSMDMLIAFLRDMSTDYHAIYEALRRLGAMVSEYFGSLVDTEQDHFVVRSQIVSEAVLECAPDAAFGSMIRRFYRNVSPIRICRYDVFRRYGYDAGLMIRAFTDWHDGKEFYERLYMHDDSPYFLQQEAIYLSRKRQHSEAFSVIDEAITVSGGHIWSIRNSYAIILFKANIEHASTPTGRRMLQESMDILTECYCSDRRKPFHAVTFADQALQFRELYGTNDENVRRYLETAKKWLEDEGQRSPWHRDIRRLKSSLDRASEQ